MYAFILAVHNVLRWVVLILGYLAVVRAWSGWLSKKEWASLDRKLGIFFSSAIDTQLLLGIVLYFFLSPITKAGLVDFGAVMSAGGDLRFFVLEHSVLMVLAVIFAHLGNALAKKAQDAKKKHKQAAIWFTLAIVSILVAIPWWRPLLPGM